MLSMLLLCGTSCSTTKENNLSYFKNLENKQFGELPNSGAFSIKVEPDDELVIVVTSSVPAATAAFNAPLVNPGARGNTSLNTEGRTATYIVDNEGCIVMPVIGTLHVGGLTTEEIKKLVTSRVAATVKDPFVNVTLNGFYVNVMGEVKEPTRVKVTTQRFTVLDALAAAGDMTEFAKREDVMVIREINGKSTYCRINLRDTSVFDSPFFYLKQNDVVYVNPNEIKIDNSKYNQNNAYKLSVISTIVSASSVIASLIIALAVK